MSARDIFHKAVIKALEKEQWIITDDPLVIRFGKDRMLIDLGVQKILIAEKAGEKIAVEIKSFLSESELFDYHTALGQFLNYRLALQMAQPEIILYLAVPRETYNSFFSRELAQASVKEYQVKLIIYDPYQEVIVEWKK